MKLNFVIYRNQIGRTCIMHRHPNNRKRINALVEFDLEVPTTEATTWAVAYGQVTEKNIDFLKRNQAMFWEGLYFIDTRTISKLHKRLGKHLYNIQTEKFF